MTDTTTTRSYFHNFAAIFSYPNATLADEVTECIAAIQSINPQAAALVRNFADHMVETPLSHLEEEYTSVFDLDPKCALHIGYHLFGESYKRSIFLLGLNERYAAVAFTPPGELPDHLTVILHCLAEAEETAAQELIVEGILPALDRMTGRIAPEKKDEIPVHDVPEPEEPVQRAPYMAALEALRLILGAIDTTSENTIDEQQETTVTVSA